MSKTNKIIHNIIWILFIALLYLIGAVSILIHNEYTAGAIFLSVAVILYFQISILDYRGL